MPLCGFLMLRALGRGGASFASPRGAASVHPGGPGPAKFTASLTAFAGTHAGNQKK
jgi:hypothetical protein